VQVCKSLCKFAKVCASLRNFFWNSGSLQKYGQVCKCLQVCASLCKSAQVSASLRKSVKVCTSLVKSAQICVSLQKSAKVCTSLHKSAQVCTSLHKFAQVCTSLHKSAQVCTSLHMCVEVLKIQPYSILYYSWYDIWGFFACRCRSKSMIDRACYCNPLRISLTFANNGMLLTIVLNMDLKKFIFANFSDGRMDWDARLGLRLRDSEENVAKSVQNLCRGLNLPKTSMLEHHTMFLPWWYWLERNCLCW